MFTRLFRNHLVRIVIENLALGAPVIESTRSMANIASLPKMDWKRASFISWVLCFVR